MNIVSIRIKNLASLSGEHLIDFESDPLASAGLIAIIGKTGAGKSTILDAMCLALFNRIPRLKDSDGKIQDVDGSELLTNSPLTVLRRGTAHGYAELCFIAQDQKRYIARWELKRSREKADGKLQNVQRYLKCVTDGVVVADKAKAVDENIKRITQLSFEQFTRAVLLAQSEVTAFLKARDNERGELLEYLTNSAIFGKIGQLAYEKTKLVATQRKELENVLGHIELLTDEQVAELSAQFQHSDHSYQQLEAQKSQLQKQQQWFESKQKLDSEIIIKQQLVEAQYKLQQELNPERERLARLEIFAEVRPMLFQQQQLLQTKQQLLPRLKKQQQLFDHLLTQFETEKAQFMQAETAVNELQQFESTHHDALNDVRKCIQERDFIGAEFKKAQEKLQALEQSKLPLTQQQQKLEQQIQHIERQQTECKQQLESSQQFTSLDQGLSAHVQQLEQFIQQYQNIEYQLGQQAQVEQQLSAQKVKLQQSIQQFGHIEELEVKIAQAQQQRELKINQLSQIEQIQQKVQQFFELKTDIAQQQEQLNSAQTQQQALQQHTLQADQAFQSTKSERIQLQQVLQQQRLLHAENVEHLRAELQEGEPCLVCGSTSHPYKMEDTALSKALFELQQQQEQQANQKELESFQAWQQAQQQLTKLNAEIEQRKTLIQQLSEKISPLQSVLIAHGKTADIALDLTQTKSEINMQFEQIIQQHTLDLQQLKQQSEQCQHNIKTQQYCIQNIQQTEHLLHTANSLQNQVQHIAQYLSDAEKTVWQQQTSLAAQQLLVRLKTRAQQLEQLEQWRQQLDQTNQQFKTNQQNLDHTSQHIRETAERLSEIKQKGQQNTEIANQLIQQMTGLTGIKANEWLIQHDHRRQQTQSHYQQIKQHFEQLRHQFEQDKSQLEQLQAQLQQNQSSADDVENTIQHWLKEHPEFELQDLKTLAEINPAQVQQIRQKLQHAERLLNEADAALKTIQEQLQEHLKYQPEIDPLQLEQHMQEHQSALNNQLEIRDQLKLKLELHQQNVVKQKQFVDQIQNIQQEEHRWGKISGLMGDATGKKFRDYAQQYNLDILLEHANQQLNQLSQRYTLKRLDHSLSLAIIDHDMDGETRSVASLSGGESFLTALALSLAIANMASGSMKIESLFIDEGFGTLDASSLHMVMNALDQLQNQGRKVVLISHIQEMHERIPVQIQVKALGAGASTIEVVG
ncbi:ATP-dependent dsDNA exonuclease [Acinetobacter sp. ANC 4204]|uniref:AAA family ATPase n=1 Tax=Acinetobacter sp. ANC 4204 TaxID=1977884 RepID=UPI000A336B66|nr:AAA family ATPase [Acinetobacter sp. ANC 4204]OTG61510.1 ATP-dependent dsDNA exonuclease [Acinetobacter sp. ANC 4204]